MPKKPQAVVILRDQANRTPLDTLAANAALQVEGGHATGMLNGFLMKKVRALIALQVVDAEDLIIVGMARGGATVTEIKTAIEMQQLDRSRQDQANVRVVLFETLEQLYAGPVVAGGQQMLLAEVEVSLGGGKGIPFDEGEGWQWFVYNWGNGAQVAGAIISIDATYYGAWLGN